jgi:hypothetical protein
MTFVGFDTRCPQVALAFGRRFGNAVERNRGRRRTRAAFRAAWAARADRVDGPLAGAYLISGSRQVLVEPFTSLVTSIDRCLGELVGHELVESGSAAGGGAGRPDDTPPQTRRGG